MASSTDPKPDPQRSATTTTSPVSRSTQSLPVPRMQIGPYRVIRLLGEGGMGVVYSAEDPRLGRQVAIKVLHEETAGNPRARQRFLREARSAAIVKSDHIITVHEVNESEDGTPYLVLELLEGESLRSRLNQQRPLPISDVLRIGREAAAGLAAAHARGLIHRDITPANIWLERRTEGERVKLLDFGLARGNDDEVVTGPGAIIGTPGYFSPEQANGQAAGPQSDLFSLGCVLYYCATGAQAFPGKNTRELLAGVLFQQPLPPREVNAAIPPALAAVLVRLLHKDPESRYGSAAELIAALDALAPPAVVETVTAVVDMRTLELQPAPAVPNGEAASRALSFRARRRTWLAVGAAAALLAAAGAFVATAGKATPTQPATVKTPEPAQPSSGDTKAAKQGTPSTALAPLDAAWLGRVSNMKGAEQYAAVSAEILRRNPGMKPTHIRAFDADAVEEATGLVRSFQIESDEVEDLSPLRAITSLWNLSCTGSGPRASKLTDLTPLAGKGMVLIDISNTRVSDLRALEGLKLYFLDITGTNVADLTSLGRLQRLDDLKCEWTTPDGKPLDFSPLRNVPDLGNINNHKAEAVLAGRAPKKPKS